MELVPLILVPVVVLILAVVRWAQAQTRRYEDALRRVGDARGLVLSPSTWTKRAYTRGETEGVDVCLDTYDAGSGDSSQTFTRVRTRHADLPKALRIGSEGVVATVGKALGVQHDVPVGDPGFDDAVVIRGEPEAAIVARLSPSARRAIAEVVAAGGTYEDGVWTLTASGFVSDEVRLEEMLRLAVAASRALVDSDPTALLARAESDPEPGVRRRALELAVREGAPDEWLTRLAGDEDPHLALIAARACGARGRLRELLSDEGVARSAAVALAAFPEEVGLEAELLRHLAASSDVDVIEALGRVASVRAVPPLRTLGGGAAREAVRAIQARAQGEVGGLAVADAEGGEVAVVDERSRLGRLSQARSRE